MAKGAILGQPARYNASLETLNDGDALALQVDQNGALMASSTLPVGTGDPRKGAILGMPARYNANAITLFDGDYCALQTDVDGNLITQGVDNPIDPPELALEPIESPFIVGSIMNFFTNSSSPPDEPFTLNIQVNEEAPFEVEMEMDGSIGTYSWQTYYEEPFVDVDDTVTVWVTGVFDGDEILSESQVINMI